MPWPIIWALLNYCWKQYWKCPYNDGSFCIGFANGISMKYWLMCVLQWQPSGRRMQLWMEENGTTLAWSTRPRSRLQRPRSGPPRPRQLPNPTQKCQSGARRLKVWLEMGTATFPSIICLQLVIICTVTSHTGDLLKICWRVGGKATLCHCCMERKC